VCCNLFTEGMKGSFHSAEARCAYFRIVPA
jgi:hypothetical protein